MGQNNFGYYLYTLERSGTEEITACTNVPPYEFVDEESFPLIQYDDLSLDLKPYKDL